MKKINSFSVCTYFYMYFDKGYCLEVVIEPSTTTTPCVSGNTVKNIMAFDHSCSPTTLFVVIGKTVISLVGIPLQGNGKLVRGAYHVVGRLLKLITVFPITTNIVVPRQIGLNERCK